MVGFQDRVYEKMKIGIGTNTLEHNLLMQKVRHLSVGILVFIIIIVIGYIVSH